MFAVITAALPSSSLASGHKHTETSASHTHSASHEGDCAHEKPATKNCCDGAGEKACCEQGACKCPGGMCHNVNAKILGAEDTVLPSFKVQAALWAMGETEIESPFSKRLKRPPRL